MKETFIEVGDRNTRGPSFFSFLHGVFFDGISELREAWARDCSEACALALGLHILVEDGLVSNNTQCY